MEVQENEDLYRIGCCVGERGLQSPVGRKSGIKKFVIGESCFLPKETTVTAKEKPNLLVEVKAIIYSSLRTITRKFFKYGQVESILIHLQNAPIFDVNYKKEESD